MHSPVLFVDLINTVVFLLLRHALFKNSFFVFIVCVCACVCVPHKDDIIWVWNNMMLNK